MGELRGILVRFLSSHGAVGFMFRLSCLSRIRSQRDGETDFSISLLAFDSIQIILAFHDLRHAISTSRTLQRKTIDRLGADVKLRTSFVAKGTVGQVSFHYSCLRDSSKRLTSRFSRLAFGFLQLVGDTKQGMQLVGENDGGVMVTMLDAQGGKLSLLGLQATREFLSIFLLFEWKLAATKLIQLNLLST